MINNKILKKRENFHFLVLVKGSNKLILGNSLLRKKQYAKLLRVDQIFLLQVASFIFRFENNLLPPFFDS